MQPDGSKQILETFLLNNPELDELESAIAEFNIFEAIGSVRQELRHSDFLAFLLNPKEKHGLDDRFLKRLLIHALSNADNPPFEPIRVKLANLSNAIVERESQNIDILISDAESNLVCVIENKVFSSEHSNQLERYLNRARNRFRGAHIIPIFLTPDGIPPEDDDSPYIPISYGDVAELIEDIRVTQQSTLGNDINTTMRHYVAMLRRHIVTDSEIAQLCREIYQSHKAAIDLIIEHMPDIRQGLANYLVDLIREQPQLTEVRFVKSYVDFAIDGWDDIPEFNAGVGWANSNKNLAIEFANTSDRLNLYVILGPVKQDYNDVREVIYDHASTKQDVFKGCRSKLSKKWTTLYKIQFLKPSDYVDATLEDLIEIIEPKWQRFLDHDLPKINQELMSIDFSSNQLN